MLPHRLPESLKTWRVWRQCQTRPRVFESLGALLGGGFDPTGLLKTRARGGGVTPPRACRAPKDSGEGLDIPATTAIFWKTRRNLRGPVFLKTHTPPCGPPRFPLFQHSVSLRTPAERSTGCCGAPVGDMFPVNALHEAPTLYRHAHQQEFGIRSLPPITVLLFPNPALSSQLRYAPCTTKHLQRRECLMFAQCEVAETLEVEILVRICVPMPPASATKSCCLRSNAPPVDRLCDLTSQIHLCERVGACSRSPPHAHL